MTTLKEQVAAAKEKLEGEVKVEDTGATKAPDTLTPPPETGASVPNKDSAKETPPEQAEEKLPEGFSEGSPAGMAFDIINARLEERGLATNYVPEEGDYKNERLHSIVLANGKKVFPNKHGFYQPSQLDGDEKEEAVKLLDFYLAKGLVSLVGNILN